MVWIINQIVFDFVSRATFFPAVNEHGVVYTHFWISGKKSHEGVTTREGRIEVLVRFFLISFTVQEDHAHVARPKITHEAAADIVFEDLSAGFAYLAQIRVAWKDDSLIFRQCCEPRLPMCDSTNALCQFLIVQRGAVWIEPGKFAELHRRAGHDEAAASIAVGRVTRFRLRSEKRDPVVVL